MVANQLAKYSSSLLKCKNYWYCLGYISSWVEVFFFKQRILKTSCSSLFFSTCFGKSKVKDKPCSGNPLSYSRGDGVFKNYKKSGGGEILYRNGEGCPKEGVKGCDYLTVLTWLQRWYNIVCTPLFLQWRVEPQFLEGANCLKRRAWTLV